MELFGIIGVDATQMKRIRFVTMIKAIAGIGVVTFGGERTRIIGNCILMPGTQPAIGPTGGRMSGTSGITKTMMIVRRIAKSDMD